MATLLTPPSGNYICYRVLPNGNVVGMIPASLRPDGRGLVVSSPTSFAVMDLVEMATHSYPAPYEMWNSLHISICRSDPNANLVPYRGKVKATSIVSNYLAAL